MDFYNSALGVSTQASSSLSSAAKHSCCFAHPHPNFHFSKLRQHAALVTALPLCRNRHFSRHSVVESRNPSLGIVSAVGERLCNGDVRNHGSSTSDSNDGDDDVAAFFARKATFERIQSSGIVACLRSDNEEVALNAGRAALNGGVSVLEVTMRTPGAAQVISKLVEEYPSATIGAGTVLTQEDAERAKEAGASFLMSPVANKDLIEAHCRSEVLFVPGVMSPSEILQARRWGASCLKLYPVSLVGGMEFVKLLKRLHPSMPIIPANGISLGEYSHFCVEVTEARVVW
uniref:Uncharacterized protein n=1 Tax=Physcomitrium patens TaxID=3218 RepID=A0A7I4F9Q5_PHYPA